MKINVFLRILNSLIWNQFLLPKHMLCWYFLTLTKLIWAFTWTNKPPLFHLSQTLEHLSLQPFSANHSRGLCHFSLRWSVGSGRILPKDQHSSKMPSHRHKSYSVICLKLTVGFGARNPNTLLICLPELLVTDKANQRSRTGSLPQSPVTPSVFKLPICSVGWGQTVEVCFLRNATKNSEKAQPSNFSFCPDSSQRQEPANPAGMLRNKQECGEGAGTLHLLCRALLLCGPEALTLPLQPHTWWDGRKGSQRYYPIGSTSDCNTSIEVFPAWNKSGVTLSNRLSSSKLASQISVECECCSQP